MQTSTLLVACDLDGTLIPPPGEEGGVEAFATLARGRTGWTLAYVTGRHRELAEAGIRERGLPGPDWLACDVGTTLHRAAPGGWREDDGYQKEVAALTGGLDAGSITGALAGLKDLRLQPPERQGRFKVSYFVDRQDDRPTLDRTIRERLGGSAGLIWSHDPLTGGGLLDILPGDVAKGHAVDYLRRSLGLSLDQVFYAGDSGNDREALLLGCRGVLVANAPAELRREIAREARERGFAERIHFASMPYAAGVLEGLERFALP